MPHSSSDPALRRTGDTTHRSPSAAFHPRTSRGARRQASRWRRAGKRAFDLGGAVFFLVVLSPVFALISLWIKLDSRGPVIYGQERVGYRGRRFRCLKFRSMRQDAEEILEEDAALYDLYRRSDYKLPAQRDPRLTRCGRFLRRLSLDELPQLVNVLRGEMSLVGPRPVVPEELDEYPNPDLLLSVRPGMTGAWATQGRSRIGYPERARIELDYVLNWSFRRDVVLLFKTVPAVFDVDGTY